MPDQLSRIVQIQYPTLANPSDRTGDPLMYRLAPDIRVRQLVGWLDLYATEVTNAREVLRERSARAASGISHGNSDNAGRVRTSRGASTTERNALNAVQYWEQVEQISKHIAAVASAIREGRHFIASEVMRGPDIAEPEPPAPCKEGQHGKAGAIVWGDTTCDFPADKAAMCSRHYLAWYRYRRDNGIDTTKDFAA